MPFFVLRLKVKPVLDEAVVGASVAAIAGGIAVATGVAGALQAVKATARINKLPVKSLDLILFSFVGKLPAFVKLLRLA